MISGTSIDYSGRLVDLSFFPDVRSSGTPGKMTVDGQAKVTAGVSKAIQGFVMSLLTPAGANIEDPQMGTNFAAKMSVGSVRYPSDIAQIFAIEASRAVDWWNLNSKTRPLDEQIGSVNLVSQQVGSTSMTLSVSLSSRSGTDISFLIPVGWSN